MKNSSSIIYRPYPAATAATEASALAAVYAFILKSYKEKKGAGLSAQDDAEGDMHARATRIIQED